VNEAFLGIIAFAVLVMAAIQVAFVVLAARAAKQVGRLATQFEQDIRPLIANLQSVTGDAARATAMATAQVERADRILTDMSARLEQTLGVVQEALTGLARSGAWIAGIKAVVSAFQAMRSSSRRASSVDEDDPLFIG
jgi:predicted PurR-regulated permease PerM